MIYRKRCQDLLKLRWLLYGYNSFLLVSWSCQNSLVWYWAVMWYMWGFCFRILSMHINSLVSSSYFDINVGFASEFFQCTLPDNSLPRAGVWWRSEGQYSFFIRDSTGVSDSVLILFGALSQGVQVNYLYRHIHKSLASSGTFSNWNFLLF